MRRRSRRRRWRRRVALPAAIIVAAGACSGVLALADRQDATRLPRGTTIDGIDISQRTEDEAVRMLRGGLGRYPPPVEVRVAHRTYAIQPETAGVWIDYRAAVRRALARRGDPGFIGRAWRELTSRGAPIRERARVHVDRALVRKAVARLARIARRPPRDASLRIALTGVRIRRSHAGMRVVDLRRLTHRAIAAFARPGAPQLLRARTRRPPPRVTTRDVRRRHPVVITVSRREGIVRVFRPGRLVGRYRARAGTRRHRTPAGRFRVATRSAQPVRIGFRRAGFRARGTRGAPAGVTLRAADARALYRDARIGAIVLVGG